MADPKLAVGRIVHYVRFGTRTASSTKPAGLRS